MTSNRRPALQSDGSDNLSATVAADRAFPAAVAELGRWLYKSRRLCRDYEVRADHSEAMLRICMIRIMVRRLAKG